MSKGARVSPKEEENSPKPNGVEVGEEEGLAVLSKPITSEHVTQRPWDIGHDFGGGGTGGWVGLEGE